MASMAAFFQMDGFAEDFDVLPIPSTAFDSYMPQLNFDGRLVIDPAAANVHDLENLMSPAESEPLSAPPQHQQHQQQHQQLEHSSPDGEEEEPMSASEEDEEDDDEDFSDPYGAHQQHHGHGKDVFAVDLAEEGPETPSRRHRSFSGSRFSPFPSGGAGPSPLRSKIKHATPKLSASLPSAALAMMVGVHDNKRCICCGCSNTPMWRDGRDGQRLCNACGIRWQKYGVCCPNCHYVPRKLENNSGSCRRCQGALPPPVPTRRRSTSVSSAGKPGS